MRVEGAMRRFLLLALVAGISFGSASAAEVTSPPLSADQIMARVAANQDRSEAERTHYIYLQHIRMVSRKTGGKVMCEEITDSRVSPQQKGSQQQLLKLDGRHWQKGRYVEYSTLQQHEDTEPKPNDKEATSEKDDLEGMDIDLVESE